MTRRQSSEFFAKVRSNPPLVQRIGVCIFGAALVGLGIVSAEIARREQSILEAFVALVGVLVGLVWVFVGARRFRTGSEGGETPKEIEDRRGDDAR